MESILASVRRERERVCVCVCVKVLGVESVCVDSVP